MDKAVNRSDKLRKRYLKEIGGNKQILQSKSIEKYKKAIQKNQNLLDKARQVMDQKSSEIIEMSKQIEEMKTQIDTDEQNLNKLKEEWKPFTDNLEKLKELYKRANGKLEEFNEKINKQEDRYKQEQKIINKIVPVLKGNGSFEAKLDILKKNAKALASIGLTIPEKDINALEKDINSLNSNVEGSYPKRIENHSTHIEMSKRERQEIIEIFKIGSSIGEYKEPSMNEEKNEDVTNAIADTVNTINELTQQYTNAHTTFIKNYFDSLRQLNNDEATLRGAAEAWKKVDTSNENKKEYQSFLNEIHQKIDSDISEIQNAISSNQKKLASNKLLNKKTAIEHQIQEKIPLQPIKQEISKLVSTVYQKAYEKAQREMKKGSSSSQGTSTDELNKARKALADYINKFTNEINEYDRNKAYKETKEGIPLKQAAVLEQISKIEKEIKSEKIIETIKILDRRLDHIHMYINLLKKNVEVIKEKLQTYFANGIVDTIENLSRSSETLQKLDRMNSYKDLLVTKVNDLKNKLDKYNEENEGKLKEINKIEGEIKSKIRKKDKLESNVSEASNEIKRTKDYIKGSESNLKGMRDRLHNLEQEYEQKSAVDDQNLSIQKKGNKSNKGKNTDSPRVPDEVKDDKTGLPGASFSRMRQRRSSFNDYQKYPGMQIDRKVEVETEIDELEKNISQLDQELQADVQKFTLLAADKKVADGRENLEKLIEEKQKEQESIKKTK